MATDTQTEISPDLLDAKIRTAEARPRCEGCIHWDVQMSTDGEMGACHKIAPHGAWVKAGDRDREWRWPLTMAWDFCGDFCGW